MGRGVQESTREMYPDPVNLNEFITIAHRSLCILANQNISKSLANPEWKEYPEEWFRILERTAGIEEI